MTVDRPLACLLGDWRTEKATPSLIQRANAEPADELPQGWKTNLPFPTLPVSGQNVALVGGGPIFPTSMKTTRSTLCSAPLRG